MRTLLMSLACVMLVGCAKPVPAGMEKMGSVESYVYNSGNQTQRADIEKKNTDEVVSTASDLVMGTILEIGNSLLLH